MKGEVITKLGAYQDGKYSVAVFVLDLDSQKEAVELMPILDRLVSETVKNRIRHGLHVVDDHNNENPPD